MNHDEIESKLTDAFGRRDREVGAVQPSLAEVHRRAGRRASRRGAARAGALVAAGLAVVGLGFVASSRNDRTTPAGDAIAPVATQAAPTTTVFVPWDGTTGWELDGCGVCEPGYWTSVPLTAEVLWESVASRYAMSLEQLVAANPGLDISQPPTDGQVINLPIAPPPASTMPGPAATWPTVPTTTAAPAVTWPATTAPPDPSGGVPVATTVAPASPTSTVAAWQACALTDEQIARYVDSVRSLPGSGETAPTSTVPALPSGCEFLTTSVPAGWTLYSIVPGDTLYRIAQRHCTTPDALAAGNAWSDGTQTTIFPGGLIAVPTC